MLNESLKGLFKGEFTEVILICVESGLPEDSNATVVDVRNNPNYSDVDCVVLLDSKEHQDEVSKNIKNGYRNVSTKRDNSDLKVTVLPLLSNEYIECHEDVKYSIRHKI